MKKRVLGFVSAVLCATLLASCASGTGSVSSAAENTPDARKGQKLPVYTNFYTMQDPTKRIGGDKVTATNLVPPGTEPHDWEPQPDDIVGLKNTNVFTYNGVGMEHWADSVPDSLRNDKLVTVEASSGISLLEGASRHEDGESPAGESAEEEESSTDPHVWLSPLNAEKEVESIKNAFVQADPANQETYEANYSKYVTQANELDSQFRKIMGELKNKDLIVMRQAFGYLCKEHGLNQVAIEGLSADSKPDTAKMAEIIRSTREYKVTTIFFEELVNSKMAQAIVKATGAETAVPDPVKGLSDENKARGLGYFSIMEKNPKAIHEANGG